MVAAVSEDLNTAIITTQITLNPIFYYDDGQPNEKVRLFYYGDKKIFFLYEQDEYIRKYKCVIFSVQYKCIYYIYIRKDKIKKKSQIYFISAIHSQCA